MKKNHETPEEKDNRLRKEIEEKKNLISEKHGGNFDEFSNDQTLPPEIENDFLDSILKFENAFKDSKQVQVFDYLGQPSYRSIDTLSENEVTKELERMKMLMLSKNVNLESICHVDDKEMYRFITEEFFFEEITDMQIPGMMNNYIYEEFHPNHEDDIRKHAYDFLNTYLNKENDYYKSYISRNAESSDWHNHFREAFSSFHLNDFIVKELDFDTEKATLTFDCDFVGRVENSDATLHFVGEGTMDLLNEWDFWCVDKIVLPNNNVVKT